MLRILLADDHNVIRLGLRHLLERKQGWKVCGEASNGREAVEMAVTLEPDIAIVDLSMPGLNGLEATRQIAKRLPRTAVLIYTMNESEKVVHDVLSAGAKGMVLKSDAHSSIVQAVEALAQGKPFFTSHVAETVLKAYLVQRAKQDEGVSTHDVLTAREREVLQLLAEGKVMKEIGVILDMSHRTVNYHKYRMRKLLGATSDAELVRYAIRNHIVAA
jgi:DNA-binding NarL/FixJ family response regulator